VRCISCSDDSAKCVWRHPADPGRDEFRCQTCGQTFYGYELPKEWRTRLR